MENIREYVLRIVVAALLCALCQSFFNHKKASSAVIRMITGLLLAVTVLSPVVEIRLADFEGYLRSIREDTAAIVTDGELKAYSEQSVIITERCEAYILDKAKSLNLDLAVEIRLAEDLSLRPECIRLTGTASPYAQSILKQYITENLGIPEEKQQWCIS